MMMMMMMMMMSKDNFIHHIFDMSCNLNSVKKILTLNY